MSYNGVLYLSGAMEHASDGKLGADWRAECSPELTRRGFGILDITGMDVAYSALHGDLFRCTSADPTAPLVEHLQRKANIRKHFVHADLDLIQYHADAMIVKYDNGVRKGAGTVSECQFAYNMDMPVFLVNTFQTPSELPGWLFALTTKVFNTFDELYEYFDELPSGILKIDRYGNRRSGIHYLCSLCGTAEEKHNSHFVSKVSPTYCKNCVELVKSTHETHYDRYTFFTEYIKRTELKLAQQSNIVADCRPDDVCLGGLTCGSTNLNEL